MRPTAELSGEWPLRPGRPTSTGLAIRLAVGGVIVAAVSGCGGGGGSSKTSHQRAGSSAPTTLAPPSFAKTVNVAPARGRIMVELPGSGGFTVLATARQVPVGTLIDATAGVVRLTAATTIAGQFAEGDFQTGVFEVLQDPAGGGLTELRILDDRGARARCGRTPARIAGHRLSKRLFGRLIGDATGRFSTQGEFASATVRGTAWGVRDRCDGTLTIVRRGVVVVSDFGLHRQIILRAGHSYLARAR